MNLTGPQCQAARVLVEWPLELVAKRSGVDVATITAFEEKAVDPGLEVKGRLLAALESGGAVFIWENGGGLGVRLKYARRDVRALNKWEGEGGPVGDDDV